MRDNHIDLLSDVRLRFNIEHPSYEECYLFGYECALKEVQEEDNPFRLGTNQHEQWLEGWWAGFYGEKPLFEAEETAACETVMAANDNHFVVKESLYVRAFDFVSNLAATSVVGYQLLDLVA